MKELTATGRTVDEAVQSGLEQLGLHADDVEVDVVDEGKKGLFGIFGHRSAVVNIREKIDPVKEAKQYLENVISNMGIQAQVTAEEESKRVVFQLKGDKTALLIGKRGQTLNALQSLTQLVLNRYTDKFMILVLDIENYRKRREESLTQLANRLASKAIREQREIKLEPMPSFERKIIHSALAENEKVKTFSIGTEPNRRLVIQPK